MISVSHQVGSTSQIKSTFFNPDPSKNSVHSIGRGNSVSDITYRKINITERFTPVKTSLKVGLKRSQPKNRSHKLLVLATSQDVSDIEGISPSEPTVAPKTVKVEFLLKRKCSFGESFWVTGNGKSLGQWRIEDAVPLICYEEDTWLAQVNMPAGTVKELKFILKSDRGSVTWQPGPNRILEVSTGVKGLIAMFPWGDETDSIEPEILKIPLDSIPIAKDLNEEVSTAVKKKSSNGSSNSPSPSINTSAVKAATANGSPEKKVEKTENFEEIPEKSKNFLGSLKEAEDVTKSKKKPENMFTRDASWFRWSWTSLLKSIGRKTLMDEENHK